MKYSEFLVMTPYICRIDDTNCDYNVGYGWRERSSWVDNLFQPVHGLEYDDRKVVGWITL